MRMKVSKKLPPEINMIPMIDVIMMLLIFFLVATKMKTDEERIELQLPESVTAVINLIKENEPKPINVNILPSGVGGDKPYVVQNTHLDRKDLEAVLKAEAQKQWETRGEQAYVRMRCAATADFVELQNALKACQSAKIIKVFVAAERPS